MDVERRYRMSTRLRGEPARVFALFPMKSARSANRQDRCGFVMGDDVESLFMTSRRASPSASVIETGLCESTFRGGGTAPSPRSSRAGYAQDVAQTRSICLSDRSAKTEDAGLMEKDAVLAKLRDAEPELRARGVARAALFGSVARGDDACRQRHRHHGRDRSWRPYRAVGVCRSLPRCSRTCISEASRRRVEPR